MGSICRREGEEGRANGLSAEAGPRALVGLEKKEIGPGGKRERKGREGVGWAKSEKRKGEGFAFSLKKQQTHSI